MACLLVPLLRDALRPAGSARGNLDARKLLALCSLTVLLAACLFLNPLGDSVGRAPLATLLGIAYSEPGEQPAL